MITAQRKARLKAKITESRGRLMEDQPFFAILLMYVRFSAVPGMKKISTDGDGIYFDPDFIDKLYPGELDFLLCHQIMHIICGDIFLPENSLCESLHFSCDIHINCLLKEMGYDADSYAHLGNIYRKIPGTQKDLDPMEMTPEEILRELPLNIDAFDKRTRNKFLFDSDIFWDNRNGFVEGENIILEAAESKSLMIPEEDCGDEEGKESEDEGSGIALKMKWRGRAVRLAKHIKKSKKDVNGAGDFTDWIKRITGKEKEPLVDWRKLLNDFVQEQINDYSFSPPDRRFADTGFFLPDFNEKEFITKEILFMADTSGSVDDDQLAAVYSEIKGAIEQFGGKLAGRLGFFDVEVSEPVPFESADDLTSIIPYGYGGTDFCPIFEYIAEREEDKPACVVIFTDGYGPYPEESAAMGIPVLWIINNNFITPPWGKVARMIEA